MIGHISFNQSEEDKIKQSNRFKKYGISENFGTQYTYDELKAASLIYHNKKLPKNLATRLLTTKKYRQKSLKEIEKLSFQNAAFAAYNLFFDKKKNNKESTSN